MNKRDFSFKHSLTTLSVCSLLAFSSTAALAQTGDAPVWRTDLTGGETTTYALSDLAPGMAGKPVKLTGSNNSGYFDFTVKPDEVVTSGELTLNFTVSPSMLANVTQLNIFLNGELQQTAALSAKQIGKPQSLVFNLDSKSFRTGQNQVRVEFVGHYQTVCQRPVAVPGPVHFRRQLRSEHDSADRLCAATHRQGSHGRSDRRGLHRQPLSMGQGRISGLFR